MTKVKICKFCQSEHSMRGNECRVCKDGRFRYKMNRLDQIKMFEDQNGKCKLCDTDIKMFVGHKGGMIDHDHKTNMVRGILCNRCNTVVGGLENHVNVQRLLKYVCTGD